MPFLLRRMIVPDDYARVAAILSMTTDNPTTPERLASADAKLPAGTIRQRLVAVASDGVIAAYGVATHEVFAPPGRFFIRIGTDPAYRRQGAGSMLWEALVAFAREQGATSLSTAAQDNDQTGIAFAEKRGFTIARHIFESSVDLTANDPAAFAHVPSELEASGIRFCSLADHPGEEMERALYALDELVAPDNPGEELGEFPAFADWRQMMLQRDGQRPEFIGIAMDGDRVVGLTTMYPTVTAGLFDIGFTGVHPAYRGRGIALAMKVLAAQTALRFGANEIRTGNDSRNLPMLAVNRKLGYQQLPGRFEYERPI